MTVRVIDTNPDRRVVREIVCGSCGKALEYVPGDVYETPRKRRRGQANLRWIVCASCYRDVVLPEETLLPRG